MNALLYKIIIINYYSLVSLRYNKIKEKLNKQQKKQLKKKIKIFTFSNIHKEKTIGIVKIFYFYFCMKLHIFGMI